jgi:hypothetical protein
MYSRVLGTPLWLSERQERGFPPCNDIRLFLMPLPQLSGGVGPELWALRNPWRAVPLQRK